MKYLVLFVVVCLKAVEAAPPMKDAPETATWLSEWGTWGTCTGQCGSGVKTRTRTCTITGIDHPKFCDDEFLNDYDTCTLSPCPINGNWGTWTSFSACSATCAIGEKSRTRVCDSPAEQYGGQTCLGEDTEYEECFEKACLDGGSCSDEVGECDTWARLGFCSNIYVKLACPSACGYCVVG